MYIVQNRFFLKTKNLFFKYLLKLFWLNVYFTVNCAIRKIHHRHNRVRCVDINCSEKRFRLGSLPRVPSIAPPGSQSRRRADLLSVAMQQTKEIRQRKFSHALIFLTNTMYLMQNTNYINYYALTWKIKHISLLGHHKRAKIVTKKGHLERFC